MGEGSDNQAGESVGNPFPAVNTTTITELPLTAALGVMVLLFCVYDNQAGNECSVVVNVGWTWITTTQPSSLD